MKEICTRALENNYCLQSTGLNIAKAYLSLTSELERVKRQLGIATTALQGYADCGYDSRSFDDGLLTFNARQALEYIAKMGPPHET